MHYLKWWDTLYIQILHWTNIIEHLIRLNMADNQIGTLFDQLQFDLYLNRYGQMYFGSLSNIDIIIRIQIQSDLNCVRKFKIDMV